MPASITLTVAHLPTSTSFFLSTLQPLNYVYRGRVENTIGFGSSTNPAAPADFWITQEVPGVPAGAAHVAFPAANKSAVQAFFIAGLKAGGKVHGEPAVRDSSGYYSAAIIDFDGNSIEAVYRPTFSDDKENDIGSIVSSRSAARHDYAASTVAKSSVSRTTPSQVRSTTSIPKLSPSTEVGTSVPKARESSGDFLDGIVDQARTAANLARQVVTNTKLNEGSSGSVQNNAGSSDAIFGTLLGVAAGAALHYAFTNRTERRPSISNRSLTEPAPPVSGRYLPHRGPYYQAIGAPSSVYGQRQHLITLEDNDTASTVRPPTLVSRGRRNSSSVVDRQPIAHFSTASNASKISTPSLGRASAHGTPPTSYKAPTVITSAEIKAGSSTSKSHRRSSSSHSHRSSKSGKTVVRVVEETMVSPRSEASTVKPAPSKVTTILREREPEEYPLPPSRASTWTGSFHESKSHASSSSKQSRHTSASKMSSGKKSESGRSNLTKSVVGKIKDMQKLDVTPEEVKPEDSVSQVSSVKSSRR